MNTVIDKNKIAFVAITVGAVLSFIVLLVYFLVQSCGKSQVMPPPAPSAEITKPPIDASKSVPEENRGPTIEITTGDSAIAEVAKAVARHVYLPTGHVTVSTVQDADSLRKENSVFYQYAQNGDRVLFYEDRAILYNPQVDRVIDIIHLQTQKK